MGKGGESKDQVDLAPKQFATTAGSVGVFSIPQFVTIGDDYGKKNAVDSRDKGKQFQTSPPKRGKSNDTLFAKDFQWLSDKDKFVDSSGYLETQPLGERKLGFGSHDAHKRDEFMLHVRTEQWRETLKKEGKLKKQFEEKLGKAGNLTKEEIEKFLEEYSGQQNEGSSGDFQTQVTSHLYDIGRDNVTEFSQKCARDTFYDKSKIAYSTYNPGSQKRLGPHSMYVSSGEYGKLQGDFTRPEFARQPIVRETFFRTRGIL